METYISTDIEADGPIPGEYSMLSFGSVALNKNKQVLGTFEANLELLPNAKQNKETMDWWNEPKNISAYKATRTNLESPESAIRNYVRWIKQYNNPVFVGYPSGFDFTFIYWYLIKFAGESPFSFSAIDIKTYAMSMLLKDYRESTKRNMPKRWFEKNLRHTHNALDDAMEQGMLFINMLNENRKIEDRFEEYGE